MDDCHVAESLFDLSGDVGAFNVCEEQLAFVSYCVEATLARVIVHQAVSKNLVLDALIRVKNGVCRASISGLATPADAARRHN
jgi:hypothetical protein